MKISNKRIFAAILAGIAVISVSAPSSLADDYSYVNAEHLNVRSAGSIRGKIVATVDKGYRMTVLENASSGWKRVLLENGQEGYVNGKYLSAEAPYYEKVTSARYVVKVASAFVRSDGLQQKIAVVTKGDQLEAVSDRVYFGIWVRVRIVDSANPGYEGRVGYISKRLIESVDGFQIVQESQAAVQDEAMVSDEAEQTASDSEEESAFTEEIPAELNSAPAETTGSGTANEDDSEEDLAKLLEGL